MEQTRTGIVKDSFLKRTWKGMKSEFKRIIWPSKKSVAKQTLMIVITVIVLGIIIKLLDMGVQAIISLIVA